MGTWYQPEALSHCNRTLNGSGMGVLWASSYRVEHCERPGPWRQQDSHSEVKTETLPLALAVAAGTAYPPFFAPCKIETTKGYRWFVDGGIFDNMATKTPSVFHVALHSDIAGGRWPAFDEVFTDVLVLDGSRHIRKGSSGWGRLRTLWRLPEIVMSHRMKNLT